MTDPIASCLTAAETDSAADEEEPHPVDMQLDVEPLFYVMPLYDTSLDKELAGTAGDEDRIARIFASILDGVAYAHAEEVIHRDLKPGNILMNYDGGLVVSDFGLGRRLDSDGCGSSS